MSLTADTGITQERLEELLADESIALVHRALWLLLWEDGLRVLDLLALEVQDVRFEEQEASIAPGRAATAEPVVLSERAAGLLRELIGDRTAGPVFAVGSRVLTWELAVQTAQSQGHAIHGFRTAGKRHRQGPE